MFIVGFSTYDITPEEPMWLGGYASRTRPSCGVHDHIYAKAMFISDGKTSAVLVSCDLLCLMQKQIINIRSKVFELYGINNITIGATHTHSAPETRYRLEDESYQSNSKWLEQVENKIVKVIGEAKESAEAMKLYAQFIPVPCIAKNRRAGETIVDDSLMVIRAIDLSGKTKGIIINYACHCTILDSNNYLISADYPGYIYQVLQNKYHGVTVMFFNGACGDINIGYSADDSALGIDMGDIRTYANAERKANLINDKIEKAFLSAIELEPKLSYHTIPLEFPLKEQLPESQELRKKRNECIRKINECVNESQKTKLKIKKIYYTSLLENIEGYDTDGKRMIEGESTLIGLGDILMISFPLELFCELGLKIKELFSKKWRIAILGYTNGYYGYLPTGSAYEAGGYECETSVHSKDSEKYLLDVMKKLRDIL